MKIKLFTIVGVKVELSDISDVSISINNMLGKTLLQEDFYVKDLYRELDVNTFSNGVYLMELYINDTRFVKQLIIEK